MIIDLYLLFCKKEEVLIEDFQGNDILVNLMISVFSFQAFSSIHSFSQ